MQTAKTVLHALQNQAASLGDRPALWTRKNGHYRSTSWRRYAENVRRFALGLHALGFRAKHTLGILSFNREEWLVSNMAAMALGGAPVGLYTNLSPEQIAYVAGHAECRVLVLENDRAVQTVLELKAQLPKLTHIVVLDGPPRAQDGVLTYEDVLRKGTGVDDAPYTDAVAKLDPDALGTLIYTSGTTGNPKGVMLTHHNLIWTARQLCASVALGPTDVALSYLPLSHIAEQLVSIHVPLTNGMQVFFAESMEKLPENLKEVRPTLFFAVPRVWEKFKAKLEEALGKQSTTQQRLFALARKATFERHSRVSSGLRSAYVSEGAYRVASATLFRVLKTKLGLDRTRIFVSSAAPIGKDVLDFFLSIDVPILEVYGQSEVTGPTSTNTPAAMHQGTLGRPMVGVEVKIAEDGEILVRGGNVGAGYYKNPEAAAELIQDGWLHSGDVGQLDGDGYLRITGRKKEIIVTSGGKKTAPGNIEILLKSISPLGTRW